MRLNLKDPTATTHLCGGHLCAPGRFPVAPSRIVRKIADTALLGAPVHNGQSCAASPAGPSHSYVPALRAMRLDPITTLHAE